ncbi:PPC domain-containing protein [Nostoc sp.]|uniref:PPC domain-containing protein n=1 Tax=Nostoc sp. TaxID=1180 RepID=UPI002FF7E3DF
MSLIPVGKLDSTPVVEKNQSLSKFDPTDVFKFSIDGTRNINLSLTNISAGDDADLKLYRDTNNNGIFDGGDRFVTQSALASFLAGNKDEAINYKADAGTYFAQVSRSAQDSVGDVSYNLALSATTPASTSDYSNLLPVEFEVGHVPVHTVLAGAINISDGNTAEVYHFSLNDFEGVNIKMNVVSADADIRLIRDIDGDRIVDPGEEVKLSAKGGTTSESIPNITDSGDYYLQVNQFTGNTSYAVFLDRFTTTFA